MDFKQILYRPRAAAATANKVHRSGLVVPVLIGALLLAFAGAGPGQSTPKETPVARTGLDNLKDQQSANLTDSGGERRTHGAAMVLAMGKDLQASADGRNISSETNNQAPTYLRDVLPILMARCARCHNEQARFVYNWLDYNTAFGDRREIRRRVWDSWQGTYYKESMPIANSPESLAITDEERLKIKDWVMHGGVRGVAPPPIIAKSKAEKIKFGERIFTTICAACHQPTGRGVPNVFPPLAGSDFLNADKNRAIKIVINGRQGEVTVNGLKFNNSMPQFPLTDEDVANVLTFVYNSFQNSGIEVAPEEVKALRAEPPDKEGPRAPPPPSIYD